MARTARAVQQVTRSGLAATYSAPDASNGETIPNDGKTILHIKNTNGTPLTVTIATPGTVDGLAVADRTVTVPATTGDRFIGPFPTGTYNQPGNVLNVDYSSATGATVAALSIPA
ncbi:MAG: hypothetical protein J0I20_35730 [Chloroflexi bacterium]|nr:hypothetical protein [Chloroflexota bacterium]OJV86955.1 MAG: hypothetical protein BGO39_28545 [Chloroflexi bacterium 54-19]